MEAAPYAIETQSALWFVTVESGVYADWNITHLCFRGADKGEVWGFLCRYLDEVYEKTAESERPSCITQIILADDEDDCGGGGVTDCAHDGSTRYFIKGAPMQKRVPRNHDYGGAHLVIIKRMDVIEFRK